MNFGHVATVTTTVAGSLLGAAVGNLAANAIQARHYNDPDWANLDPAFVGLFAALFTLPSLELCRWILTLRAGKESAPVGLQWLVPLAKGFMRLATAAIGLRLGYEAGWWTAWSWDHWGSTAQYAADAHREFSNVWIGGACAWGGALAVIGYRLGRTLPPVLAFLGAFVALRARLYLIQPVAHLYWGPHPNSDSYAFVLAIADLLATGVLVPAFAVVGYLSGRWLYRQRFLGGAVCGTITDPHTASPGGSPLARE